MLELCQYGERELVETAELLASELVANARNSAGPAHVRVKRCGTRLRVSVWDTNPALPVLEGAHGREGDAGDGLGLIRLCADSYGGFSLGESGALGAGGKLIWFELTEGPGWRARTRRSALG
ncbi:ATP-binding protein [Streptomyces halobius]|uniref:ATP-binding protein n=1 Tax=Streptomyces halobius TaxID=2879846 RepID=A0ABY4ME10_9ACTN|nr:ATP-binding protein [Streptomyces halobius]UQA94591.1 ATP-binding protein [Streptomyces halobius]